MEIMLCDLWSIYHFLVNLEDFFKSEVSLLMNVLRLSISTYIVSNTQ